MKLSAPFGVLWRFSPEKAAKILKEAGFDAVDYSLDNMCKDTCVFNGDNYREEALKMRKIIEDAGLEINQSHAPFSFDGTMNKWRYPGSYENVILPRIIRSIEIAGLMGAKTIVVHPLHHWEYRYHEEEIFQKNVDYYRMLLPYAQKAGIKLCVENMYQRDSRRKTLSDDTCSNKEEFVRYVDSACSPSVVACLDIGHVGLVPQNDEAWDFVYALGHDRLQALHVHDNFYRDDDHQPPFVGSIDWNKVCKALGEIDYQGDFTYECGWRFIATMDDDFVPVAMKYMADVGRHLMAKIDAARPQK